MPIVPGINNSQISNGNYCVRYSLSQGLSQNRDSTKALARFSGSKRLQNMVNRGLVEIPRVLMNCRAITIQ